VVTGRFPQLGSISGTSHVFTPCKQFLIDKRLAVEKSGHSLSLKAFVCRTVRELRRHFHDQRCIANETASRLLANRVHSRDLSDSVAVAQKQIENGTSDIDGQFIQGNNGKEVEISLFFFVILSN
jgi:hypothetical protein